MLPVTLHFDNRPLRALEIPPVTHYFSLDDLADLMGFPLRGWVVQRFVDAVLVHDGVRYIDHGKTQDALSWALLNCPKSIGWQYIARLTQWFENIDVLDTFRCSRVLAGRIRKELREELRAELLQELAPAAALPPPAPEAVWKDFTKAELRGGHTPEDPLQFEELEWYGQKIRAVYDVEQCGVWVVARDVLASLGYAHPSRLPKNVSDSAWVLQRYSSNRSGAVTEVTLLAEQAVHLLVAGSSVPHAAEFQRWMADTTVQVIRMRRAGATASAALGYAAFAEASLQGTQPKPDNAIARLLAIRQTILQQGYTVEQANATVALLEASAVPTERRELPRGT